MPKRIIPADDRHQVARDAMLKALSAHAASLSPEELLALASQVVGSVLAYQDRARPVEALMATIEANIEEGNRIAIETIMHERGKAQTH